jgi:predicted regulator of Ras-like GTPase activity (Roadblock/LC7/MglB family)
MSAAVVLSGLRDVTGVYGSFMVSPEGATVARDMAAMFTDDLLDEVAGRLLRLRESFGPEGSDVLSYVLRFREHLLFVRSVRDGVLCVLSDPGVNMPALRMGASLAVRRLGPLIDQPPAPPVPAPPAPEAPAPATIRYRGAVVPKDQ